jgi:hypothetical protein
MQVKCSKCAQPIGLTDIIELKNGHLSHVDCKRPHVLTPEERALVFVYCSGHVVARCPACDVSFRYTELAADLGQRTHEHVPSVSSGPYRTVRAHLFRCAMLPSEIRLRAQAVRETRPSRARHKSRPPREASALKASR